MQQEEDVGLVVDEEHSQVTAAHGSESGTAPAPSEERSAIGRLRWYMLLRWAGVAVLYTGGLTARQAGHYHFSLAASNVLAPLVLVYNVAVWRLTSRWTASPPRRWRTAYRLLGDAQCSADLVVLAIACHFAGGIESFTIIEPIA